MTDPGRAELIRELQDDRWLAHLTLFRHRHPEESPAAHKELVEHINRPLARLSIEGFRGFAKSTYLEETAVLKASFGEFHFMVVLGASYGLACDRLTSIKREFEVNRNLISAFGALKGDGDIWQAGKIVLTNGCCLQAVGREQSMTGMKYLDHRPDAALVDDLEDPDEVRTDPERARTWDWFLKTFLPSLSDPTASWVRVLGTRRGNGSLPERLEAGGWKTVKYPIEYRDGAGERRATWPSKFPVPKIDVMKADYTGDMHTWAQEYMCEATSSSDRVFKREMFRVEPRLRRWEPVYAMIDPARTVRLSSALTGWAVWSWTRNPSRLVVRASGGGRLLPDEIIALAFDIAERFDPIRIGVEKTGLEQWLSQPIRAEQVRRGRTIPYWGVDAISQLALIGGSNGLQPYFAAGEVIFACAQPELEAQLLSFPYGPRDIVNALAYAPAMRPGASIFDNFSVNEHVDETLEIVRGEPLYLAANATGGTTAAILVQASGGRVAIIADWVMEGSPLERIADIGLEASLLGDTAVFEAHREGGKPWEAMLKAVTPDPMVLRRQAPVWIVGPRHGERYTNVGLLAAIRALPGEVRVGGAEVDGGLELRERLGKTNDGLPCVTVGPGARWTLRALSGGYCRAMVRGRLQDHAEEGPYRVLIEGLLSFCGMLRHQPAHAEDGMDENFRVDQRTGRRYVSAMPQARGR